MRDTTPKTSNPDTAPADRSIWKDINRETLERQTQALFRKQHVAGRFLYPEILNPGRDQQYPLPFEVEKSLADDFAFIAASQPEVRFVSAAAIEQSESKPSLSIKLAANEGISSEVKKTFDELFEVLRKHARKDITRESCQEQLFGLIVQLNCNKILGRLGSARFQPPMHLVKTREPLPARLRKLCRNSIPDYSRRQKHLEFDKLDHDIGSFEAAFRDLDTGKPEQTVHNVERAIKQAFRLTEDGLKLPDRLKALGCPASYLDKRDVREVGKVSNYWRISRHLAICSQRFRPNFACAEWMALPNYKPSTKSKVLSQQYVHAEIQLLVHFELKTPELMPRTIGVSKEACFLCDSFIRAHGQFSITGAHRQVFPQWTVPDLKEYTSQTTVRFRQALCQVLVEVQRETQRQLPWRPFPLQSAINLKVINLLTPSVSTLPLQLRSHLSEKNSTVRSQSSSTASAKRRLEPNASIAEHEGKGSLGQASHEARQTNCQQMCIEDPDQGLAEIPIDIITDKAIEDHVGWIHTYAALSSPPNDSSQGRWFNRGSISLRSVSRDECLRKIHLADIQLGEELVLQRNSVDAPHEFSFILVGPKGDEVCVRCQWLIS